MPATTSAAPPSSGSPPAPGGCCAPPGDAVGQPSRPIEIRVTTAFTAYAEGVDVVFTPRVCNVVDQDVRFYLYRGHELTPLVRTLTSEHVAAGAPMGGEAYWDTWKPGECKSYRSWTWHQQRIYLGDERQENWERVPGGFYRAGAMFEGQPPKRPEQAPSIDDTVGFSSPLEVEGVVVTIGTNKPSYSRGDTVTVTATVCNPFDHAQTQTFARRPGAELRIDQQGQGVEQSAMEAVPQYQETFASRQCKSYTLTWTAEQGIYDAYVLWWGHGANATTAQTDRPMSPVPRVVFKVS